MRTTGKNIPRAVDFGVAVEFSAAPVDVAPAGLTACSHCGAPCPTSAFAHAGKTFCCQGCRTVFERLTENGLADFYRLSDTAGVRVTRPAAPDQFAYLDAPETRARLVDFSDARLTRFTFRLPAIHCIACVWLLENLFQLQPGIGSSQVNFPR